MIINREQILQRILQDQLITHYQEIKSQLQPAGFDLRVEKVYSFESQGAIDFDNSERKISDAKEMEWESNGWLELKPGTYKVQFAEEVRLPADLAAHTILRSSLMRCGCVMHQGFWDPGYNGKGESVIIVGNPKGLKLKKGAKIAQMVFHKLAAETDALYEGIHQRENL
ncbi:deoxyuridine 5'-triphosphate nucleotidohydrolase [Candidatus Micrarchaeota archaeon]|nr:deoxyuridine 5'-triphosphate nucleotidohydrolase [Candidatus Micrarchaeota archaeon]